MAATGHRSSGWLTRWQYGMPGASITCPVTASRADRGVAALTVLSVNIAGQGPINRRTDSRVIFISAP
jgi:hypothetical protein